MDGFACLFLSQNNKVIAYQIHVFIRKESFKSYRGQVVNQVTSPIRGGTIMCSQTDLSKTISNKLDAKTDTGVTGLKGTPAIYQSKRG